MSAVPFIDVRSEFLPTRGDIRRTDRLSALVAPAAERVPASACARGGSLDSPGVEAFYVTLLVLSGVVITWFTVFVVYKLYKGQS